MLGVPVLAQGNDGDRNPMGITEREQMGFTFPEDIRGNESFWGNDILITIDDCNNLAETKKMFNSLRDRGLKATFFPNSNYLPLDNEEFVKLWREMYREGFEIGYHTQSHEVGDFTKEELSQDLDEFEAHMRELLGDESFLVEFARPPYGNWNNTWMQFIREEGLSNIRWNFVPNATANSIDYFEAVVRHPDGGRIILLHPRVWDGNWLESNIEELKSFVDLEQGRIATLSSTTD